MAAFLIFHYAPAKTFLHTLDPRIKMLILTLASSILFLTAGYGLVILVIAVAAILFFGKIPALRVFRDALSLWILAFFVFLSRIITVPGWSGFISGIEDAGRLGILIFLGHIFLSVTTITDIQKAASVITGSRIAFMMSLSFSMVPNMLDTSQEILAALSCRALSFRRHPIRGIKIFGLLFIRKTAAKTAGFAEALESRSYRYDRGSKPMKLSTKDAAAFFLSLGVLAVSLWLKSYTIFS